MWENFKEERTTDLARFFIGKSENLTIPHIKLLKLMYLADRESLKKFEHSITGDRYVSMRLGPVLSKTYGLIKGYDEDEYKDRLFLPESVWYTYIQKEGEYELHISPKTAKLPLNHLTPEQCEIAEDIQSTFGHFETFELVEWVHENCEEWKHPQGKGKKGRTVADINIEDIFRALGKSDEEIGEILFSSLFPN